MQVTSGIFCVVCLQTLRHTKMSCLQTLTDTQRWVVYKH
jgi:hypothetical protein